jgi:hypothetical protein
MITSPTVSRSRRTTAVVYPRPAARADPNHGPELWDAAERPSQEIKKSRLIEAMRALFFFPISAVSAISKLNDTVDGVHQTFSLQHCNIAALYKPI